MALLNLRRVGVRNYRCFGDEAQIGRLAPLTLLVGDNSTGKTSFLAMIRILWSLGFRSESANFKAAPYDLGSFEDIAHRIRATGPQADQFCAYLDASAGIDNFSILPDETDPDETDYVLRFVAVFGKGDMAPELLRRRYAHRDVWLEEYLEGDDLYGRTMGTGRGAWEVQMNSLRSLAGTSYSDIAEVEKQFLIAHLPSPIPGWEESFVAIGGSPMITSGDLDEIGLMRMQHFRNSDVELFAGAPMRSKPRRTYDPARVEHDPEGDGLPMYLADMDFRDPEAWRRLRSALERFGRNSGLFDEIRVRRFGKRASDPFQLQVRKSGSKRLKGPWYNLMDVGYGVSQALPLITELLRDGSPDMFLLQQPEVHLHPSAQAALGSLLGDLARKGKQLIVETHSDHLIDRVRMDVRDKKFGLTPEHLSILYFERKELDVHIHSLKVDEEGNLWKVDENGDLVNVPESYRRFFMEESERFLGF